MARYTNTLRINKNNKSSYRTYYNLDKVYERKDTDMYFRAQEGDRCDTLAYKFYGDTNLWWFIARINSLKSMNIPAATNLRIPINAPKY